MTPTSTSERSGDIRARADSALALAQSDPARAEALAIDALTRAIATGDHHSASVAARARGLAARERHDLNASLMHLRQAVRVAEGNGLATCAGQARLSLAGTLAVRGEWVAALREADLAEPALTGVDHARLQVQRSYVLRMHGQLAEAMEGFRRALPALRRHGDTLWEARLHANRGLGHYQLGDLATAEADLRRADELYRSLGQGRLAASARQNLGMVVGLRGDIPAALTWFEEADRYFAERGQVDAMSLNDRCLVLLQARLVPDALRAAEKAVELLAKEGRLAYLAQAQLKLAEAALLAGDWAVARTGAEEARRAFAKQRRPAWSALARLVAARAAWAGDDGPAVFDAARRAADALAASGFASAELDARLLAAQVAIAGNRVAAARRQLALAHGARTRGTVQVRTRAWHAEALLRLQDGDRGRALAAVRAGMDLLERYRGALGATELRAHASGHATDLATLGLRLALEGGRAASVLHWSERFRAGALRMRPVRPPDDARLAAALGELRAVVSQVERAALGGQPFDALVTRQAALEETVAELARHADTSRFSLRSVEPRHSLAELADALGDTALVEFVDCDGTLHAVLLADGRARLYRLAPRAAVASEIDSLRFSLRRLAFRHGTTASLAGAADTAALAAKRLDGLLFAPLGSRIGDRPLAVVPTGILHALPWSALPSCARRPVSVAPSAAVWHRAATAPPPAGPGRVVLVAGPDVPNSAPEVAALARRYPGAVTLTGRRATCEAVCGALDGARLAHVAAHGRFRADNAPLSSLQLVDGPLTVYDLEALRQPPSTLVLSACDSGASDVRPGDELMGLAAALLSLGTRTVVASVFPVPDDATRRFMLAFHRALNGGHGPAEALARVQSEFHGLGSVDGSGDQAGAVTTVAFVCLGAGG